MYRRITFKMKNGDEHSVIVDEHEDSRKMLREDLGVKRLPHGTEAIKNIVIPIPELAAKDIRPLLKAEKARHKRVARVAEESPDLGAGWPFVRDLIAKDIELMEDRLAELKTAKSR